MQEPLRVTGGGPGRLERALQNGPELGWDVDGGRYPVDEAHGPRFLGPDVVVEKGQLLRPAETNDARQSQDRPVRDQTVLGGAQTKDRVLGRQPHVARDGELEPAADAVA